MTLVLPKIQKDKVFDVMARTSRVVMVALFGAVLAMPFMVSPAWAQSCGTPPASGLVGYWKFDDGAGSGTAADSSGNGNTGTLTNMDTTNDWVDGIIGGALMFNQSGDGDDDHVLVSDSAELQDLSAMSACSWVNASDFGISQYLMIMDKTGGSSNDSWKFYINDQGGEIPFFRSPALGYKERGPSLQENTWHHVCATWDGTDGAGGINLYLDGELLSTGGSTGDDGATETDAGIPISIGQDYWFGTQEFRGAMDDLRLYNRALSVQEIGELYSYGFGDEGSIIFNQDNAAMQYCDGTDWRMMGIGSYNPSAVSFDGGSHLARGAGLSGVTDSFKATLSAWIKPQPSDYGTIISVPNTGNGTFAIGLSANYTNPSELSVTMKDASDNSITPTLTGTTNVVDGNWHHVLFSVDTAAGEAGLYVDEVSQGSFTFFNNNAIDFTWSDWGIGVKPTNGWNPYIGQMADVWFDTGTYINFSSAENRRKFISENGMPMYLGPDGSIPTGSSPDIFLSSSTDNWHVNNGTGGGFTENGTLTYSSSRPGDDVIASGVGSYLVNSASATQFGDSVGQTFSFGFTPTSGNLLVVAASWDKVISGLSEASGQWTQIAFETSTTNVSGVMYYKISDGTETDITLNWTNSEDMSIWVGEYQGLIGTGVLNQSASANSGGTAVTSQSTGTTGATTAVNTLAIAMFGSDTGQNTESGRSYSNGFNELTYLCSSCNGSPGLAMASNHLISTGTVEATFSNSDTGDQQVGIIGVFEKDPAFEGAPAGLMQYDKAFNVMKYFNGAEWVAMGPIGGASPTNGLVGHWRFDETSGTTAADSSGNGNDATVSGGTPTWASGLVGNSVADAWIRSSNPTGLSTTEITLSTWVKASSNFDYSDAIALDWGFGTGGFTIYGDASGDVNFGVMDGGSQRKVWAGTVKVGEWQHWAGTYDGSTLKLYLDGELVASDDGYPGITLKTAGDLYVTDGDAPIAVDETRVYNRALSATEILQLYRFDKSGGLGDVDNGCTSPARPEGTMLYNADNTLMQYCNGEEWIRIGQ